MIIKFEFELREKVQTPFGDIGIIETAAKDSSGIKYYVQRSQEDKWFFEDQLLSMDEAIKLSETE